LRREKGTEKEKRKGKTMFPRTSEKKKERLGTRAKGKRVRAQRRQEQEQRGDREKRGSEPVQNQSKAKEKKVMREKRSLSCRGERKKEERAMCPDAEGEKGGEEANFSIIKEEVLLDRKPGGRRKKRKGRRCLHRGGGIAFAPVLAIGKKKKKNFRRRKGKSYC